MWWQGDGYWKAEVGTFTLRIYKVRKLLSCYLFRHGYEVYSRYANSLPDAKRKCRKALVELLADCEEVRDA